MTIKQLMCLNVRHLVWLDHSRILILDELTGKRVRAHD